MERKQKKGKRCFHPFISPKQQGNQWNRQESCLKVDKNIFPHEIRINIWNSLPLAVTEDKNFILFLLDVIIDVQKVKYLTKITGRSVATKIKLFVGLFVFFLNAFTNPKGIKINGDFAVAFMWLRMSPETFSIRYNPFSLRYQEATNSCGLGRNLCLLATYIRTDYFKPFDILVWHN